MALNRATEGLDQFPSAKPDGELIPYSIGNPYGAYNHSVAITASTLQTLPADAGLVDFFCSSANVMLRFGDQVPALTADDTFYEDSLFIPINTHVQVLIPAVTFKSIGDAVGTLRIQLWRPWKAAGISVLKQSI